MLKAPVEFSCSFSKISCSSFGRRGGAGCGVQAAWGERVVVKARRKKPGRMARAVLVMGCIVVVEIIVLQRAKSVSCFGLGCVVEWDVERECPSCFRVDLIITESGTN